MKKRLVTLITLALVGVGLAQSNNTITTNGGVPVGDNQNSKIDAHAHSVAFCRIVRFGAGN